MQLVNELAIKLPKHKSKLFLHKVREVCTEFALDENICPRCTNIGLEEIPDKQLHDELDMGDRYEILFDFRCPVCGWNQNIDLKDFDVND